MKAALLFGDFLVDENAVSIQAEKSWADRSGKIIGLAAGSDRFQLGRMG